MSTPSNTGKRAERHARPTSSPSPEHARQAHQPPFKRISQACDRCRIRKAKCGGGNPCSKCRVSNSLCVFGDKISPGRTIFPKGYVAMLERQQRQLMAGIQILYRKYKQSNLWDGMDLPEHENQPRIHDMLAHLGVLQQNPSVDSQRVEFQEFGLSSSADSSSAESPAGNATCDVHKVALTLPNTMRDSASPPCSAEYSPSDSCPVSFDDELAELLSPSDALSQAHTGQSCATMVAQLNPHHVPIDYLASSSLDQLVWTGEEFADCPTTCPASPTGLPTHFGAFNTWVDANLCLPLAAAL